MIPDRTSLSESTTQIVGSAPTSYDSSRYWIGNREVSFEEWTSYDSSRYWIGNREVSFEEWNSFHEQNQTVDPVIAELKRIRKQLTEMTSLLDQIKRKV